MGKEDHLGHSKQEEIQNFAANISRTTTNNKHERETEAKIQAEHCLAKLYAVLQEPIEEKPTAKYIADTAQRLVADLNEKRKIDSQLFETFRQSLEQETLRMLETVQQQMYQSYQAQSAMVDQKLQELFACLDTVSATEAELQTFRQSLKNLYQEMHAVASPEDS